jgi:hypothetical protein
MTLKKFSIFFQSSVYFLAHPNPCFNFATMLQKEVGIFRAEKTAVTSGGISVNGHPHSDNMPLPENSSDSDFIGIGGSFFCLVHCLAPQLISLGLLGAGIGSWFSGEYWAFLFWITCLWAVVKSSGASRFPSAALFLWIAFLLFSIGLMLETFFGAAKLISYLGSLCLISAHLWNYRQQVISRRVLHRIRHEACCGSSLS